ncbi:hypothetical protein FRC07_005523 [Ceratobasidium sp. 392]|nr:hypothetical protein FRC07_005523 [Ceratobasidium sp. 392]
MARALRSSGAVTDAANVTSPATAAANGTPRARVLKRKRTTDDEQHSTSPRPPAPGENDSSASPLTDLAPSPAVKHEVLDDLPPPPPSDKQLTRSPTPGAFLDGCDAPPSSIDAHKLLAVLEMFDTQNLLARHVPPAELSLRAMLKTPTHSLRALRAAISALAPVQSQTRAAPSLELTAQRSFCELALGLIDEIAQKQLVSKDRASIYQVSAEHKSKYRAEEGQPVRFALQQTIHGVDYYTSIADDALTPQKAASLATGQSSLTAIIPSLSIPISSMPTLSAYSHKPHVPPPPLRVTFPGMLELSYGPRASFAPTYDSGGSAVTRATVDGLAARRLLWNTRKAMGPPPLLPLPDVQGVGKDTEMRDVGAQPKQNGTSIHPDLVPIPIDPSLTSGSAPTHLPSPPAEPNSSAEPDLDPDLTRALDELALEDSVRGLLHSNARAMARLVDLQNERLQRWDGQDMSVLDVGEGEEKDLAACIEKTLGMLADLRPRTVLASLSSNTPTSLIPPTSVLRTLHRTLPTEPAPGYRGTLEHKREMALKDNTTIKVANIPAPVAPAAPVQAGTPVSAAKAALPRPGVTQIVYPAHPGQQMYGSQHQVQQYPAGAAVAGQQAAYGYPYHYPVAAAAGYPTPTAGQATYPAPVAGQTGYPTPGQTGYPTPGQTTVYPTPGQVPGVYPAPVPGQAATYPTPAPGQVAAPYNPVAGTSTPRVITNVVKPAAQGVWSPGQGYTAATPTSAPVYTPTVPGPTGYNPAVGATGTAGYNPAVSATGYNPAVNATGYSPAVSATGYNPAVAVPGAGAYVATPTPIKPAVARGPIPAHVRSTPGTPGTPTAYLPNTTTPTAAAVPGAGYAAWNGTPARPT